MPSRCPPAALPLPLPLLPCMVPFLLLPFLRVPVLLAPFPGFNLRGLGWGGVRRAGALVALCIISPCTWLPPLSLLKRPTLYIHQRSTR